MCLCSKSEAFPNVIGEAMATAVQCIATDVGDCAHVLGDTGFIAPVGDVTALADCIKSIRSMPHEQRDHAAKKSRERILDKYEITQVCHMYYTRYMELISEK